MTLHKFNYKCFHCNSVAANHFNSGYICGCNKLSVWVNTIDSSQPIEWQATGCSVVMQLNDDLEVWLELFEDESLNEFTLYYLNGENGAVKTLELKCIPPFIKETLKETIEYLEQLLIFK